MKKRHAKLTQVMFGDYVRTKRPVKHDKRDKMFKFIATKGGILKFDNGQRWNVAKCLFCPRPESDTFYAKYEENEQELDVSADNQVDNDVEANLAPLPYRRSTRVTRPSDRYCSSKYYLLREEEMLCMLYIVCVMLYRRARLDAVTPYGVLCT